MVALFPQVWGLSDRAGPGAATCGSPIANLAGAEEHQAGGGAEPLRKDVPIRGVARGAWPWYLILI